MDIPLQCQYYVVAGAELEHDCQQMEKCLTVAYYQAEHSIGSSCDFRSMKILRTWFCFDDYIYNCIDVNDDRVFCCTGCLHGNVYSCKNMKSWTDIYSY